jgi:hypothetical protein
MVGDILVLCATALLFWAPVGRFLLSKAGLGRPDQGISLSIAFGMGVWGYFILLLGSLGLIHGWSLFAAAVVLVLLPGVYRRILPFGDQVPPSGSIPRLDRAFLLAAAVISLAYIAIGVGSALAPELSFDALNVHLP